MIRKLHICADQEKLARCAAGLFLHAGAAAEDRITAALAGGRTPRRLFEILAAAPAAEFWPRARIFWSDERAVAPTAPASNYRVAAETLLRKVPVPEEHIFPMHCDVKDLAASAREYERTIRAEVPAGAQERPAFDVLLLGLGRDGHTASLFPGSQLLDEERALIAAVPMPAGEPAAPRLTFTLPLINAARCVILLVSGEEKRRALQRVLARDQSVPAARVQPDGALHIVTDLTRLGPGLS